MKRKNFLIVSTVGHKVTKHTWNSSIREIEKLAKELAVFANADFHLTGSESVKEGFDYVTGSRTWTNQKNNCSVIFTVTKEATQ